MNLTLALKLYLEPEVVLAGYWRQNPVMASSRDRASVEATEVAGGPALNTSLYDTTSCFRPLSVTMQRNTPSFKGRSGFEPSTQDEPEMVQG